MKMRSNRLRPALPLPTIVVLFSMYDDRGYFAWHTEPIIEGSSAYLKMNKHLTCQEAKGLAIQDIVIRVSFWYDEFFKNVFLEQ